MGSQLRKLRGGRTQFERASNTAVGYPKGTISPYDALRQQLKTDVNLQSQIKKMFNLAGGYPAGRMQIHHKVFLKNLEPYFFHFNKKGDLVLRPQKDINRLVKGIQQKGWDIGNLKKNLSVLPKYIHQGSSEVPGHLSVHSILRRYTDLQGITDLSEYDNIREVIEDGQVNKYGNRKFVDLDGKVTLDPELSLITNSQIGMSEDAATRIFRNNDLDDLITKAAGKLEVEAPVMRSAIAGSVYLADDVPLETKRSFIQELGGKGGEDVDELFDNIRKAEGFTKRRMDIELDTLKNKPLPKNLTSEQLTKRQLQLDDYKKKVRMQDELLKKLNDRPSMRQAGFSSPFSRNLKRKNRMEQILRKTSGIYKFEDMPSIGGGDAAIMRHVDIGPMSYLAKRAGSLIPVVGAAFDEVDRRGRTAELNQKMSSKIGYEGSYEHRMDQLQLRLAEGTVASSFWAEPVNVGAGLLNLGLDVGRTLTEKEKRDNAVETARNIGAGVDNVYNAVLKGWF